MVRRSRHLLCGISIRSSTHPVRGALLPYVRLVTPPLLHVPQPRRGIYSIQNLAEMSSFSVPHAISFQAEYSNSFA
jgi:hypothetical protein